MESACLETSGWS